MRGEQEADDKWVRVMTQELGLLDSHLSRSAAQAPAQTPKPVGRGGGDANLRARAGVAASPCASGADLMGREWDGTGGEGGGASGRKQTVNELWLSQHTQALSLAPASPCIPALSPPSYVCGLYESARVMRQVLRRRLLSTSLPSSGFLCNFYIQPSQCLARVYVVCAWAWERNVTRKFAKQARRTVECLAEESDYVEGLVRIASRCILVCSHLLSPRQAAPLTSAAAGLSLACTHGRNVCVC